MLPHVNNEMNGQVFTTVKMYDLWVEQQTLDGVEAYWNELELKDNPYKFHPYNNIQNAPLTNMQHVLWRTGYENARKEVEGS
jgi:hypothetical protein